MQRIERVILTNLLHEEEYARKVLPFMKQEYFQDMDERVVFDVIQTYITKFNAMPTKTALGIVLSNSKLSEGQFANAVEIIDELIPEQQNDQWLLDMTESFCKEQAVWNAIGVAITINKGENKKFTKDAIPSLLQDALNVGFDSSVGHDYLEDAEKQWEFYHRTEERIPFDIDLLNKITKGGLPKKTLTIYMAAINVGKSLIMCHHAGSCLSQGNNVLYITLEMSEEQIRERIDANLLDITTDDLMLLSKDEYVSRVNQIKLKTAGKLFIKEFPTAGAHVGHFKAAIAEMKIKKGVVPDIIFIDYINICAGQRLKTSDNSNAYVKAIAEEVRGMAMEMNIPIVSATQLNREGMQSSDVDMTDVAESIGLPQTADLFLGITENEELEEMGQYLFKQLKNRLNKRNNPKRFMVGVDKDKLRLYNLDVDAQKHVAKDNSKAGKTGRQQAQPTYALPTQNDGNKRAGLKRIKVT